MNADSPTSPLSRNRFPVSGRDRIGREGSYGRPEPDVRRAPGGTDPTARRPGTVSRSEVNNLAASFPLLFFGAACVAVAALVLLEGSRASIGRIPLWVPFLALGLIALVGGTLSVFALPDETEEAPAQRGVLPSWPDRSPAPREPSVVPEPTARKSMADAAPPTPSEIPPYAPPTAPRAGSVPPSPPIPSSRTVPPLLPVDASATPTVLLPDDATALLREIDLIAADLRSARRGGPRPRGPPGAEGRREVGDQFVARPMEEASASYAAVPFGAGSETAAETELPRRVRHCVGCGSVILETGATTQCQVCGEPLCSDCRERSFAEGKPNLCPLCGLLDSVHSRGMPGPQPSRTRA